jgi:hypothetical protein
VNHISFVVGDGTRIKFWHDSWCGDQPLWVQFPELYQPLRVQFPELFRIARVPEAAVADHIPFIGSTRHWVIAFCRLVQDWELEVVASFMELLYSCSIRRGNLDSLC